MSCVFDILNFPSGTTMVTVACDETCQPDKFCNCHREDNPMDQCSGHTCDTLAAGWICICERGMTLNKAFKIKKYQP